MSGPNNPFAESLNRRIDGFVPGGSKSLAHIDSFDPQSGFRVLREIIGDACQAQNEAVISVARKAISQMPPRWLETYLADAIKEVLNLDDEWEYRRLLEILHLHCAALLQRFIDIGRSSENAEVREAAQEFSSRYGKQ